MNEMSFSKIKRLDGALLLIFRELMRQRRTTVVAERLGMTQSAVSHALARLRDLFDDPLFLRRPNGLEPTQRALEIAPRIDELIRLTDSALDSGKAFDPATTQRNFRIGGGDFMSALIAAPLLHAFEREAPGASFIFRFALGQEALDALTRDEIDIAVGRLTPRDENFLVEPLYEEEYCIVARRNHPRLHGDIDVAAFSELGHVIIALGSDLEQLGDNNLKRLHIERRMVAAVPRFLTAFTLVAQSDAILTVQRRLALRYADAFQLQVLAMPYSAEKFSVVAVRRGQDRDDAAISWLIEKVRQSAATN
ncbi:MAG TPA: LysR family transcriptional regulator [Steroidobacteraceae bacterium]|nr:LysR family transcriptional regulator [Steroidobacteraceae bacterium]